MVKECCAAARSPVLPSFHDYPRRFGAIVLVLAGDALALTIAISVAYATDVFHAGDGSTLFVAVLRGVAVLVACLAIVASYAGRPSNPVNELRQSFLAGTLAYVFAMASLLFAPEPNAFSPIAFLCGCAVAMTATPFLRSLLSGAVQRLGWNARPIAIFHTGVPLRPILERLKRDPACGLRPVAVLASDATDPTEVDLPFLRYEQADLLRKAGVRRALVALSAADQMSLEDLEHFESVFPRLLIVQAEDAPYTLDVKAFEIGRSLAMQVTRKHLSRSAQAIKRGIDLAVLLLAAPVVVPLIALLALLVKLDSRGPTIFRHSRIGRNNGNFYTYKLRTMRHDSAELLRDLLSRDEAARLEWERDRKLRNDPRVTRVGSFLRRTSLDELPQLWNVLKGDMSLVGPRPIIAEEALLYGRSFPLYCRVTPGMTGLWQISGRNTIGIHERVRIDSYYVRNWSPWLDFHILACTPRAVLFREGAY